MDRPDLNDLCGFWARPIAERAAGFEWLRDHEPVAVYPEPPLPYAPPGPGFHAVTRYADVLRANREPEVFRSAPHASGVPDIPEPLREFFGPSMINLDGRAHSRLRRMTARAFTPRRVAALRPDLERFARATVDAVADAGRCDFATDIAAAMPLRTVCGIMGISDDAHSRVIAATGVLLGPMDSDLVRAGLDPLTAMRRACDDLVDLLMDLADERAAHPRDDLLSDLVAGDGDRMSRAELGALFILLLTAGTESVRNAASWGMHLLTEHPAQRLELVADLDGVLSSAVAEITRWSSTVMFARRTLAAPATLSGVDLPAGAKVALYYWSANRDERVFADPERFDVRRQPNPHIAFNGGGPHTCLGAELARAELSTLLREVLRRLPDIHAVAPPDRLLSLFMNGVKHLPCEFTPSD